MYIFELSNNHDPNSVINNRYKFTDGQLAVDDSIGVRIERILVDGYACTCKVVELADMTPISSTSLSKKSTRGKS